MLLYTISIKARTRSPKEILSPDGKVLVKRGRPLSPKLIEMVIEAGGEIPVLEPEDFEIYKEERLF